MTIKKGMKNSEWFRRKAAEQAHEAAATKLANVRERCLQAERAFLVMAERAQVVEDAKPMKAVLPKSQSPKP